MKEKKILLAENDTKLTAKLSAVLEEKGYSCVIANDHGDALKKIHKDNILLCIINTKFAKKDGLELANSIKEVQQNTPIIFLSAKNSEEDKIKAFTLGADDYVVEPFFVSEISLRVEAILRRSMQGLNIHNIFSFSNFIFDYNRQILTYRDDETNELENYKLTSKESELMRILCVNANQIVTRATILCKIWKEDSYFNARSMDVYITKLRKYIRRDPNVDILNQHGVGFKLAYSC